MSFSLLWNHCSPLRWTLYVGTAPANFLFVITRRLKIKWPRINSHKLKKICSTMVTLTTYIKNEKLLGQFLVFRELRLLMSQHYFIVTLHTFQLRLVSLLLHVFSELSYKGCYVLICVTLKA